MQGRLTKFRILFYCLLDGGQFRTAPYPTLHRKEATERQPATLSCGVASIAFVLPGAPQKRAALCAERGSTPITPARKERIK